MRSLSIAASLLSASLLVASGCGDGLDKGEPTTGSGVLSGTISYAGDVTITRVAVAVFDRETYPPTTPPVAMKYFPEEPVAAGVALPLDYRLEDLGAGPFWAMAYGDVDPDDGFFPKEIDPTSEWFGPLRFDGAVATQAVNMELADGRWQDVPTPDALSGADTAGADTSADASAAADITPQPGDAGLSGTITYEGDLQGTLKLVGFKEAAGGIPSLYKVIGEVSFPYHYAFDDVAPGTHWVLVYLDVDTSDGLRATEIDPISGDSVEVTAVEGEVATLDLTLTLPE